MRLYSLCLFNYAWHLQQKQRGTWSQYAQNYHKNWHSSVDIESSFQTDTCSTPSLLIFRVWPPKMWNRTKSSSSCHCSMLYADNTQHQSWFRPTTVKGSNRRLPALHKKKHVQHVPRWTKHQPVFSAHMQLFVGNTYISQWKQKTTIFHQATQEIGISFQAWVPPKSEIPNPFVTTILHQWSNLHHLIRWGLVE